MPVDNCFTGMTKTQQKWIFAGFRIGISIMWECWEIPTILSCSYFLGCWASLFTYNHTNILFCSSDLLGCESSRVNDIPLGVPMRHPKLCQRFRVPCIPCTPFRVRQRYPVDFPRTNEPLPQPPTSHLSAIWERTREVIFCSNLQRRNRENRHLIQFSLLFFCSRLALDSQNGTVTIEIFIES